MTDVLKKDEELTKIDKLKTDKFIIDWLDALAANDASDKTIRNYLLGMQAYTDCTHKTPTELILETEAEIRAGLLGRERSLKSNLIKFLKQLQDKHLAPITIRTHMAGVKSFYKNSDISFPASLPKAGTKAVTLEENKPIPSKDDIRAVLKVFDPLERAILLVGASSGLSCEDIINLKVSNFKKGYDEKTEITKLPLRRIKTRVDFITFLTPEASRAVWDYLEYRGRTDETDERRQLTLEKQHVYSYNDFLFIGRHIPDTFL
jgi:integrase